MSSEFDQVAEHVRSTALLEATRALLEWDERTGLPSQAGAYRAEQITQLSSLIHQRKIDPHFGEQLDRLSEAKEIEPNSPERSSVDKLRKDFKRKSRLPIDLVQAISKACVLGQQAWERARAEDDWEMFRPHLEQIFSLRRQEAALLGDGMNLYDAMLDEYEEGAKSVELTDTLGQLRDELVDLVRKIDAAKENPKVAKIGETWARPVPLAAQRKISRFVAEKIGYSFERGRLDETSHPFCTTLGPHDVRILTRYQEAYFPSGFYGTLHEAGHGIYEQGLASEWYGLAPGMYSSLGVHESQSRLWENFVGRSHEFWQWGFPALAAMTGGAWEGLSADTLFRDANRVAPSLIRVEADEVTYNLHILIRFEIEQQLLCEELSVADAPDAWNQRYEHYLGIRPPSNRDGILQDVHWSAGLVGYFPTYSLGNIYAAQLMQAAEASLGDLGGMFAKGDFEPLLSWLRDAVHRHGACHHPAELIRKASGKDISAQPLVDYLRDKLTPIYDL